MSSELPAYDPADALRVTGNRPDVARHLLGLLRKDLPTQRERMAGLIADASWPGARELAHKLAGSALYCGAPALLCACRALEARIEENADQPEDAEWLGAEVLTQIDRFLREAPAG